MLIRLVPGLVAVALLCACKPGVPQPTKNQVVQAPSPRPAAERQPPANNELREWLVGTWSFENSCATDFLVHYNADGTLDNSGDRGTWSAKDTEVTEVITRRFTEDGKDAEKVDPPETRVYTVSRGDQNRGLLTLKLRSVSILRC